MKQSLDQSIRRVMSGQSRGCTAALVRAALRVLEAGYTLLVAARYQLFEWRLRTARRLPRPVISIGNLTTGGTGKTPIVAWLAAELRARDLKPAILLRGYKHDASGISDEAQLYDRALNSGEAATIPVLVGADRFQSGSDGLIQHPAISHFILDDGFQHRQLHRDVDLVLIDAFNPFGYDHVLPRGMLRESMSGLARADLIILTRCEQVDDDRIQQIEQRLRTHNTTADILHARGSLTALVMPDSSTQPIENLRGKRVFAFCGIGNPQSFERLLIDAGALVVETRWFADHQHYSAKMVEELETAARPCDVDWLITTEKDGVKLRATTSIPIVQARMQISIERSEDIIEMTMRRSRERNHR